MIGWEKTGAKKGGADGVSFLEHHPASRVVTRHRHGESKSQEQPEEPEHRAAHPADLTLSGLIVFGVKSAAGAHAQLGSAEQDDGDSKDENPLSFHEECHCTFDFRKKCRLPRSRWRIRL